MNPIHRLVILLLFLAGPVLADPAAPGAEPGSMATTSLVLEGLVKQRTVLTAESLITSPLVEDLGEIPLTSMAGSTKRTLKGYGGIRLTALIDQAGIEVYSGNDLKRTYVVATASDGYVVLFTWAELYNTDVGQGVFVLVARDGKPIGDDEGRIALISSRDLRTGPRHVRWLKSIEVRRV